MTLLISHFMKHRGSMRANFRGRGKSVPRGFALITTLVMMILLVVIAVGLLGLSSISLRSGDQQRQMRTAQANARLALMLAIGDLQKELGPDQRITATSGLVETNPPDPTKPKLPYMLTGVWNSRDYTSQNPILVSETPVPDYDRDQPFRRWLVSSRDTQAATVTNFATTESLQDPIELVGKRTLSQASSSTPVVLPAVKADGIPVVQGASAKEKGKLAWWVGDENCKGFINPTASARQQKSASVGEILANTQTPGAHGMQAVDSNFPTNTPDSAKIASHGQATLASSKDRATTAAWFHDLSPFPRSVLTNVTKGGLRQDLSLFLEQQSLDNMPAWPSAEVGKLPTGPLGPNGDIALSSLDDKPSVKGYDVLPWKQLAAWWRLRKKVNMDTSTGRPYLWARRGIGAPNDDLNPRWNSGTQRPAPVPIRYLLFMSFGTVETSPGVFNLRFYSYPVVVFWNPYNVDLKVDEFNVHFNKMPMKYDITKTDASGTKTKSSFEWDVIAADEACYSLGQPIRAGETAVFSAKRWIRRDSIVYHKMDTTPIVFTRKRGIESSWDPGWLIGTSGDEGAGSEWGGNRHSSDKNTNVNGASGDQIEIQPVALSFAAGSGNSTYAVRTQNTRNFLASYYDNGGVWPQYAWHSMLNWNFEQKPNIWSPGANLGPVKDSFNGVKDAPRPFMVVDMKLKTLDESEIPNKTWGQCIPGHAFQGFTDVGGNWPIFANAYKMDFVSTTDPAQYLQVVPTNQSQTFFGNSNSVEDGQPCITDVEIPMAPLTSLAQLQNLPQSSMDNLYSSGFFFQNHAIGNSFASPGVPSNAIKKSNTWPFWMDYWLVNSGNIKGEHNARQLRPSIDRSYAANHLLWDDYFFSSLAPKDGVLFQSLDAATLSTVANDFYLGNKPLPNERYKPYFSKPAQQIVNDLVDNGKPKADSWKKVAGALMVDGGFNVNSVSVDAWKTLLASANKRPMVTMESTGKPVVNPEGKFIVSRFTMPNGPSADNPSTDRNRRWCGYRELTEPQIDALAQAIVRQVKARGPFRSLGDFINRRLGADGDPLSRYGALQAALEDPAVDINADYRGSGKEITDSMLTQKGVAYPNITAATGSKFQGAPCYVTQADLLGPIAPVLNARSDTFVIRAYGESTGSDGRTAARAWCEAVIQRVPDFVETVSPSGVVQEPQFETLNPNLSAINKTFGRRMNIVSFRWLSSHEI